MHINDDDLAHGIIKPIEKQMPETLTILRLAKQEARRLGRNVVGTEMFLLGIIGEATGVGAVVLNELEINIRDARLVVEKLLEQETSILIQKLYLQKERNEFWKQLGNMLKKLIKRRLNHLICYGQLQQNQILLLCKL